MIRIEITDLATEDKAMLLKVAELLMHVAGHGMVMVPEGKGVTASSEAIKTWKKTVGNCGVRVLNVNELPPQTHAPYQHCGESDLTHADIKLTKEEIEKVIPEHSHVTDFAKGVMQAVVDIDTKIGHQTMESWLPTSNPAPKEIPLPDAPEKPKRTRKSIPKPPLSAPKPPVFEIISQGEIDVIEETFLPDMPVVTDEIDTSMKLINKMTQLVTDKRISQEDLIQVIKTSGLNEVIDVCHREDLVPLVNSNLEILLRTKS